MTESNQVETNDPLFEEGIENDGLTITVDEETNEIHFAWNPETHPEWNYLEELSKEELIALMCKNLDIELTAALQENDDANAITVEVEQ